MRSTERANSIAPDPIFGAIDAWRRADAACVAVDGDIPDEVSDPYYEALSIVMRTRPTKLAGLVALTNWTREHAEWLSANSSYMVEEELYDRGRDCGAR